MEERSPMWNATVNILNNQSKRGGPPAWGLGIVLTTPHHKNFLCYETFMNTSEFD